MQHLCNSVLLLTVMACWQAHAEPRKLAPELANSDPNAKIDVLVQFKEPPTDRHPQRVIDKGGTFKNKLDVVKAAWKAGIVVAVAAGNEGRNNLFGTTSYSSKGPTMIDYMVKPDLAAPGNRMGSLRADFGWFVSSYPANAATAVESGAAALLLEQNASLTPDTVKARLMKTASKSFPAYSTATDVWGMSAVRSNHAVWGANAVWGARSSPRLNAVWGTDAVWETKTSGSGAGTSSRNAATAISSSQAINIAVYGDKQKA